jgi:hypothetical protein
MTETKPLDPGVVPEPGDPAARPAGNANDPNQTRLLPVNAELGKHDMADSHGHDPADPQSVADEPKPMVPLSSWFKKLTPSQIIWISLSIILTFLVVFFWLIMQGRPKNKIQKPAAGEQFEEAAENTGVDASGILKNRLARHDVQSDQILTDDEFSGLAPMMVKAGGAVISAAIDPELAAMVDALKKRLQLSVDSQSTNRGNVATRESKGDFRGFKITIDEKFENQKIISEAVTVTLPKRGVIKTVNRVLESFRESDPERFVQELQNAGLEIVKFPSQPGSNVIRVQIRAVGIFGKPVAADLLISGKSVGKITLGMTTVRLENMLLSSYIVLKRKVLVNDIYHDVYKVLDQNNEPLFFIYENNNLVWGISIISEFFKTERGIGIGSSLGNIRINYPKITVGISEKKIPFIRIAGVDGLFVIQNEGVDIKKRVFPSQAKVISILIGNSLEFE